MTLEHIIEQLPFGEFISPPEEITGGLLHHMYRITTSKGIYALKILNAEIMNRSEALKNTKNAELIAEKLSDLVPVVASLKINGSHINVYQGIYYMVFPWVSGSSVFPGEIQEAHCRKIGEILGKIHSANIMIQDIEKEMNAFERFDWNGYQRMIQENPSEQRDCFQEFLDAYSDIESWNEVACQSKDYISSKIVISHRDLDPKNIMWEGMKPYVIDWEAAGFINPYQEFIEVVNYWTNDANGSPSKDLFQELSSSYRTYMTFNLVDWNKIFDGSCMGMLGWLDYCMKKALGIITDDLDEIRLGMEQARDTIKELYAYHKKIHLWKAWLDER